MQAGAGGATWRVTDIGAGASLHSARCAIPAVTYACRSPPEAIRSNGLPPCKSPPAEVNADAIEPSLA
jgi:hypothetical protein